MCTSIIVRLVKRVDCSQNFLDLISDYGGHCCCYDYPHTLRTLVPTPRRAKNISNEQPEKKHGNGPEPHNEHFTSEAHVTRTPDCPNQPQDHESRHPSDYPTSTWQWLRSSPDTLGRWPEWRWLFLGLMDTTSLLLEESRDTLNSSTASQTANCQLDDSLDVIKQDLPVTLDTSFAGPLGFRKGWAPKRTDVARPLAKETNNNDQWSMI